ncbi:MAG: hypothetical protein Q9M94_03140 [Candidatus Gracilibacteria bacterium]|nr:hypothetical protein [Candidatus Gracilibacteria bacterium]MDQ7023142.1 hypothetical protein [Candidatus Gracilibacteria bacterium]
MKKDIHNLGDFSELFNKLKFSMEEHGAVYSAMIFVIKDEDKLVDFRNFILENTRITDSIFSFYDNKTLIVLEDTNIRLALSIEKNIRKEISQKGLKYNFYSSIIQGDYIETEKKLYKSLKKRLDIAKKKDLEECVYSL